MRETRRRLGVHTKLISSNTRSECGHLPISDRLAHHNLVLGPSLFRSLEALFPRLNAGATAYVPNSILSSTDYDTTTTTMGDLIDDADIDFDRAASAFPDISLDGEGDIPTFTTPPSLTPAPAGPFDLDAFGGPTKRDVRVTGHDSDDEIGKFESEFPELEVPQVRYRNTHILRAHAVPTAASRRTRPEY